MTVELGTFGSVFEYKSQYYVYFGWTTDGARLFAGKILDAQKTQLLQKASYKYESKPNHPIKTSLTLCFVILTTDDLKGRATSFHRTGDEPDTDNEINFLDKVLNDNDREALKKTILQDEAMPQSLQEIVKKLA